MHALITIEDEWYYVIRGLSSLISRDPVLRNDTFYFNEWSKFTSSETLIDNGETKDYDSYCQPNFVKVNFKIFIDLKKGN